MSEKTAYSGFPEPLRQSADDPFAQAVQPPPPTLVPVQSKKKQRASKINMPAAAPLAPNPVSPPTQGAPAAAPAPGKKTLPAPVALNREAVDAVFRSLTHPGTGFLTNSAFMFFLVREFSQYQKTKSPFVIIGFEFSVETPDGYLYPMPQASMTEGAQRLFSAMRPLDWLAHYQHNDFAFLLPHTNVTEAVPLVEKMQEALRGTTPISGVQGAIPVLVCGIAGLPDDCTHPGVLLAAAYEAKNKGKEAKKKLNLYRDLRD